MALMMQDIEWSEPILPHFTIPEWEARVSSVLGTVPDVLRRVSRSAWLREVIFTWPRYKPQQLSRRLQDICALVTAQENACRYCYGVARSQMRLLGYSEKMINGIERDMQMADLDVRERAFVQFCRNLSRSNPRPPKSDCEQLMDLGFSPKAVAEMAFLIINHCLVNRVSTFLAIPPMAKLERLPTSMMGRLMRPLIARKIRSFDWVGEEVDVSGDTAFPAAVNALSGLPAAKALNDAMSGAMASTVLSEDLKILMFAVVARSLECPICEQETGRMAEAIGFTPSEFDRALRELASPRLSREESILLAWTRETIRFQTGTMQRRISEMVDELGEEVMLEAIGVASLANAVVRLAILLS